MNIILSKYGGFCPGVKRADKEIRKLLEQRLPNEKVYIIGPLIHNDIYNRELISLGANIISFNSIEKIIEDDSLIHRFVIRTHGVTKEQYETLLGIKSLHENVEISDLTCPSVKRIHEIACMLSNGNITETSLKYAEELLISTEELEAKTPDINPVSSKAMYATNIINGIKTINIASKIERELYFSLDWILRAIWRTP